MNSDDIKDGAKAYWIVGSMALVAIAIRFIAITHQLTLDWAEHAKVLHAYFMTASRAKVFLVQFVTLLCVATAVPFLAKKEFNEFIYTFVFLSLVSVLRYMFPFFVVSILGDLLVLACVAWGTRPSTIPRFGLVFAIPISILLVPGGLWLLGIAALRS